MFQSIMIFTLICILTVILNLVSKKTFNDREKNSPFECGFDPKNLARLPFSLQFFLITVIFVIFDVELTLLLPMILVIKISNWVNFSLTFNLFILVLLLGLFHEQNQGSLNWVK
uniref:NADH-ubiquinone oxidoreductase chain 3 n=1 Tax=Anthonomus eugenii TaxID=122869 RepID=A0A5B8ZXH5_9CUCU|nr:NADH dehydrogenase subunit 3 [Anthonomus eugenii]QED57390.1 NADH dehydrogenase subunit 3 [Anthonomus eugenii]QED57398.1 NADH dehydrogenase subunit 3 [Anthonomus eugenii]QED57424.1 NADH dehydrogenase subunit 3 [Anthonomus eugenii]QED57490.1 NADH dehydrogenase subunit 3 [Anthonomus eugenii]